VNAIFTGDEKVAARLFCSQDQAIRGGRNGEKMKNSFGLWIAAAVALAGVTGCATKNYVKTQTAPIIEHTNQLDDKTAANNRAIRDTDDRATVGIKTVQGAADTAAQNAQVATKSAGDADVAANDAVHRADSLDSVVKGLDNYKTLGNVSVTFGFDKAVLTKDSKEQLDTFAAQLGSAKSYILEVTGGTDSTGSAAYNYDLSQRRADAVVQYLASKYGVAAHRFYLIGIGKDKEVAPNTTADGRKQNRRVEIQLLSNMSTGQTTATSGATGPGTN
jgi:outer membrane protein OmpA-like peptidoglycan-associated protein